ncbi:uncharacterized protein LOC129591457 [Paramacrobiotus metropolitanus]|uniref:uncharacterized protein LOC129591457 n=1 Tax=Paramacrobiotus metropolitanus TaxID=2943436 RepID=UPI002445DD73|nr:uncharacterized protein LOC129591457 [Paramacrobiotus metropolitanus]
MGKITAIIVNMFIFALFWVLLIRMSAYGSDYYDTDDYEDYGDPPADWQDRIDNKTLVERLSERTIGPSMQNDIIYNHEQLLQLYEEPPIRPAYGAMEDKCSGLPSKRRLKFEASLWNKQSGFTSIPYVIDKAFYEQDVFLIKEAMDEIETKTEKCIMFKGWTNETNAIMFKPGKNCSSSVGMQTTMQTIYLDQSRCMEFGIIIHEILHALGFFHEHCRPDRDQHVTICMGNVANAADHRNFHIIHNMSTYGVPYDLESIMHYGTFDFTRDASLQLPVIVPKQTGIRYAMGQRKRLSALDVAKLLAAYQCLRSAREEDGNADDHATGLEPLPEFSLEPMEIGQCRTQFNSDCSESGITVHNCSVWESLTISCHTDVSVARLREMVDIMALPPLRGIIINLADSVIAASTFRPIRKQVITFTIWYCQAPRTTAKLKELKFIRLVSFALKRCRNLVVRKIDFSQTRQLRRITLYNSTINGLEKGTFMDLISLKVLALDGYARGLTSFDDELQHSMQRIHCSCTFSWLRSWWSMRTHSKQNINQGALYSVPWPNHAIKREDIYLPINCSAEPFPVNPQSINFTQMEFSINEPDCYNETAINEPMATLVEDPEFSMDPMLTEQCALQFNDACEPRYVTVENCTVYRLLEINCNRSVTADLLQSMAFAMAQTPRRGVYIDVYDGDYLDYHIFRPVHIQVILFKVWDCVASRTSAKLNELRLVNVLDVQFYRCNGMVLRKEDFKASQAVKLLAFCNTTIRHVEEGAFSSLQRLRILSLEVGLASIHTLPRRFRDYVAKLHCDCEFASFRVWRKTAPLLTDARFGEIYSVFNTLANSPFEKKDIFLPFDCSLQSFPTTPASLNFSQEEFSINEPHCGTKVNTEPVVEFSSEPMTSEQCGLQFTANCAALGVTADNCTAWRSLTIQCSHYTSSDEVSAMTKTMANPPLRPIKLHLYDQLISALPNTSLNDIRLQIVIVNIENCASQRTSAKLAELQLYSVLVFRLQNCTDIVVEKADFSSLRELLIIDFSSTTIATLEAGTFSDLPQLRVLTLERELGEARAAGNISPDPTEYAFETAGSRDKFVTSKETDGCTQGIWITRNPYIIQDNNGRKFAVFLLDTQGLFDFENSTALDSALFLLTSMFSSFTVSITATRTHNMTELDSVYK